MKRLFLILPLITLVGCSFPARANRAIDTLRKAVDIEQKNLEQLIGQVDKQYEKDFDNIFLDMRATVLAKLAAGDIKKETIILLIDDAQKQAKAVQLLQKAAATQRTAILDNIQGMLRLLDALETTVLESQRIPASVIELIREKRAN